MSLERFTHRFAEWITDYNTVRVHGELDGQTPLGRWREDTTPLREVPAEALRWVLMADGRAHDQQGWGAFRTGPVHRPGAQRAEVGVRRRTGSSRSVLSR